MKKIYFSRTLLMLCLLAFMGFVSSCDNDDEASNNGEVILLSFGPAGVQHGEKIQFIGENLDKVTSIALPGIEVQKNEFTSVTSQVIEIVVPDAAEEGQVILKFPDGELTSKTNLSFEVIPIIAAIPETAKPGTTITITGEFLNWVEAIVFPGDVEVTEFESATLNELVVTVPMTATSGQLVFLTGGTEPLEIGSDTNLDVVLPMITGLAPNPVERETELTITGTNLDLVNAIEFKGGAVITYDAFLEGSNETIIKLIVPAEVNKGNLTAIAFSGEKTVSTEALALAGDLPPLAPLVYAFYDDAIQNGWGNWGWGGPVDFNNADNVREGTKVIKKTYDGSWDALRFGGGSVSTAGKTKLVFSIYGEPGTQGKKIQLIINENWGGPYYHHTITEGEWQEVVIDLATISAPATITDIMWQGEGMSGTVFVDHFGFR